MTEIGFQEQRIKRKFNILAYITVPLALLVGMYCIFGKLEYGATLISLLPFCYALAVLWLSYRNNNINGLAYNIIHIVMFIRYVFMTFVTVNEQRYLASSVVSHNCFHQALFLMIYEMIVVFIVMKTYSANNIVEDFSTYDNSRSQHGTIMRFFILMCCGIFFLAVAIYPKARSQLFNFSSSIINSSTDAETLNGFFFVFFTIGISILYGVIINWIQRAKLPRRFKFILASLVSVAYISCSWSSGGTGVSRWGIVGYSLVSYCVLIKAFPERKNTLFIIGGSGFITIILVSSIIKLFLHHGATSSEALIEIFSVEYINEYFQGISQVEKGIAAMQAYKSSISLITFLDDTLSSYPLINHLFYQQGNSTAQFYLAYLMRGDKIIPTIAQGYAYFTIVGAPIFSGMLTYLSLKCDRMIKRSKDVFGTIVFSGIAIFCALFMAINVSIIHRLTMYFVITLLVLWIDKHVKIKRSVI